MTTTVMTMKKKIKTQAAPTCQFHTGTFRHMPIHQTQETGRTKRNVHRHTTGRQKKKHDDKSRKTFTKTLIRIINDTAHQNTLPRIPTTLASGAENANDLTYSEASANLTIPSLQALHKQGMAATGGARSLAPHKHAQKDGILKFAGMPVIDTGTCPGTNTCKPRDWANKLPSVNTLHYIQIFYTKWQIPSFNSETYNEG